MMTGCVIHEEDKDVNIDQCIVLFQDIKLVHTCMNICVFMFFRSKSVGLLSLKDYYQKKRIQKHFIQWDIYHIHSSNVL